MMRLVITALLLGLVSLQAQQAYLTRAELKKPLSEAVEKVLAELMDRCAVEKQKQLTKLMEEEIKAVDAVVKLSAEEKSALQAPAKLAVESALKTWKPKSTESMRTYLTRTSDAGAIRHVGQWVPEKAHNEPVEDWTPPQEEAAWLAALKQTLGESRFNAWNEAATRQRQKIDEEISTYLERWLRESHGPMNEDLQAKIELMKQKLALNDERITALKKEADAMLTKIEEAERKRAAGMLRTLAAETRQEFMGRSYFYVRFDRPRGEAWEKRWEDAAAKVLSADLIAQWRKTSAEERDKLEGELTDLLKPSELYLRQQMETNLTTEIDNISTELGLDKERLAKLKKLSDEAVEASLKLARKQWMTQARNYSTAERQRMSGNMYFGVSEEQQANALPLWKDGVKKLLTEAERTRMNTENDLREKRSLGAIACACLAEMDGRLMLNSDQRAKLEPLIAETMKPLMEQRRQQYWSYSPTQLFQAAGKVKTEALKGLLDDVQMKNWQELIKSNASSSRNVSAGGTMPEVSDMEEAISKHLYKMFVAERKRVMSTMLPYVEEAQRVLKLPEETVLQLTTAAKGAVEESLIQWRRSTDSYVRQNVQNATTKNILQVLAGTERVSFGRGEGGPQNTELWQTALNSMLNAGQQHQLQQVADARRAFRLKAMTAMVVGELDRRRRLNGEQCAKLEPLVSKVLTDYQPDIERYMNASWFLQYYYAMVPIAGVPEKELQAILPPAQWKLCKERDLPDAMQYWEGIENNHKNRLKQVGKGNGNQLFFNRGVQIDE